MDEGMLWLVVDKKTKYVEAIYEAFDFFENKYKLAPTVCFVPEYQEIEGEINFVQIEHKKNVPPGYIELYAISVGSKP